MNLLDKTGEPRELDRDECLRLLAKGAIGRIVFTDAAMPAVQPVTYLLDGEEIIFHAWNGSKLATRRPVLAFQADEIDPHARIGWSVVGVGQAYEVTNPDRLAGLAERQEAAWASAPMGHTIAIPLHHLTGHRLDREIS